MNFDDILDDVEQYAEQRISGASFDQAQAAMELRRAFKKNGVDVDEVRYIGGDPSLMYYFDADERVADVAAICLVAAEAPEVVPNVLSATALASEHEREANFAVEREWLDRYNADELSKTRLVKKALGTWEEF